MSFSIGVFPIAKSFSMGINSVSIGNCVHRGYSSITIGKSFSRGINSITMGTGGTRGIRAICVGVLLQRNPIVLPKLDKFTNAYFSYRQDQLDAEARPFNHNFYFKKGTLGSSTFLNAQQNVEFGYAQPAEDLLSKLEKPLEKSNEFHSLDREMDKKVYLVIKNNNHWILPFADLKNNEFLVDAAQRVLKEYFGNKLETWAVGRGPVGHLELSSSTVFFMKNILVAGQGPANMEYAWMTKNECAENMESSYFTKIKNMLTI